MHEEFIKYLKSYKENQFLIKEGGNDTDFYCLLQGKIGIWKGDPEDRDNLVKLGEIEKKGTYFGEMSTLLEETRTASVIALTDVKVFKFPGEMMSQIILQQPSLGLKLCTALAERLRGSTNKQQDIALQRNEIRDDATQQFLHAKESYQRLFIMISATEFQLRNPLVKAIVEHMSRDNLFRGGRRIRIDKEALEEMPECIAEVVKKAYADSLI